jgi:hypothetical protein
MSLFMYVALYTPLKKLCSWAVFVGAFPGAFPPMLGYVAATGEFGLGPGLLAIANNREIRDEVARKKLTRAAIGLDQYCEDAPPRG